MRNYKTNEELRQDAKRGNIKYYIHLSKMFASRPSIELSSMMTQAAETLVKDFGLAWADIEALEIAAIEN